MLLTANVYPVPAESYFADREWVRDLKSPDAPRTHISKVNIGRLDANLFFGVSRRRVMAERSGATDAYEGVINISVEPNRVAAGFADLVRDAGDQVAVMRADGEILAQWPGFPFRCRPDAGSIRPSPRLSVRAPSGASTLRAIPRAWPGVSAGWRISRCSRGCRANAAPSPGAGGRISGAAQHRNSRGRAGGGHGGIRVAAGGGGRSGAGRGPLPRRFRRQPGRPGGAGCAYRRGAGRQYHLTKSPAARRAARSPKVRPARVLTAESTARFNGAMRGGKGHRQLRALDLDLVSRGTPRPIPVRISVLALPGDPPRIVMVVQDISELRETEARRELMMREVEHRSKNTLALFQAALRPGRIAEQQCKRAGRGGRSAHGRAAALAVAVDERRRAKEPSCAI